MDKKKRKDKKAKDKKDLVGVTNSAPTETRDPVNVLCSRSTELVPLTFQVDSDDKNWVKCFEGYEHNGRPIKVSPI